MTVTYRQFIEQIKGATLPRDRNVGIQILMPFIILELRLLAAKSPKKTEK